MAKSSPTSVNRGAGKDATAYDLLELAMVDWPTWVDHVLPASEQAEHCGRIAREAAGTAERAVRLESYMYARSSGQSHQQAVSGQNKAAAVLRRGIGYSYPKQDVNF